MSHTITALLLMLSLAGNVAFLSHSLLKPTHSNSFEDKPLQTRQTPTEVAMCQPKPPQANVATAPHAQPTQVSSNNIEPNTAVNTANIHALTKNGTHLLSSAQQAQLAKQLQSNPTIVQRLLNAIRNHQLSEQIRSQLVGIIANQDSDRLFDSATAFMQDSQPDLQRLGSELASRLIRNHQSVERTARLLNDVSLPKPALRDILRNSSLLPLSAPDKQKMHMMLANYMSYADSDLQPDILTSLARLSVNDEQRLTTLTPYLTSAQPALQNAAIHALYQQHNLSPNSQAYSIVESLANDRSTPARVRSAAFSLLSNTSP
ncbi:hypothetical protein [Vibrio palustris]|uniref:HEAT repeat protein n=1 Tax=Vibrio palustris TaxID=1918946 RepID=A0A1R4B645_9VIBR|nr:hypothetical protein [Vibrio palustris]SJL84393.1 hypothetical protein VPAL9027_02376 [Vibrio palustris]